VTVPGFPAGDQEIGSGASRQSKEVRLMQCKKCGQENMSGAQVCQRCGTNLMQTTDRQPGVTTSSVGSRITSLLLLAVGVLVLVGIFLPWLTFKWDVGDLFGRLSVSVSGWDMVTGSGDVEGGAKFYAILAFAGSIVVLLGAVSALAAPANRLGWAIATVGGVLAIVGSVWGWTDLSDFVAAGANTPGVSSDYGVGLFLALAGGIAGLLVGLYGFGRSAGPSI
jgi:ribosomal protein L40E